MKLLVLSEQHTLGEKSFPNFLPRPNEPATLRNTCLLVTIIIIMITCKKRVSFLEGESCVQGRALRGDAW